MRDNGTGGAIAPNNNSAPDMTGARTFGESKDNEAPHSQERSEWGVLFCGRGRTMRTDYIDGQALELALALLMPQNRLICRVALHTGLRIGDVVAMRTEQIKARPTIREAKTGKSRRVYLPAALLREIKAQAGPEWAFPGAAGSKTGHKTRQAVWADLKRAQRAARLPLNLGPHSLRKTYAVRQFQKTGDLGAVQRALNHDDQAVTLLYAMADHLSAGKPKKRGRGRGRAI